MDHSFVIEEKNPYILSLIEKVIQHTYFELILAW